MNRILKTLAFRLLGSSPFLGSRLRRLAEEEALIILSFHRVGPPDRSAYAPLDAGLFDDVIGFCRRNGDVITFADVDTFRPNNRAAFIISFDDGYRDFVDYALPILRRHGVRCNHNFIPHCVESGRPPINVLLQDFIGKAPKELLSQIHLPGYGRLNVNGSREKLGTAVSAMVKRQPIVEQKSLLESLKPQMARYEEFVATPMMDRADVRGVSDQVEVGAHSWEHATLAVESDEYVSADAAKCRKYFSEEIGCDTDIYAVPNGEIDPSQCEILRDAGYRKILLVGERPSSFRTNAHFRFTMYGKSRLELRARAVGTIRS